MNSTHSLRPTDLISALGSRLTTITIPLERIVSTVVGPRFPHPALKTTNGSRSMSRSPNGVTPVRSIYGQTRGTVGDTLPEISHSLGFTVAVWKTGSQFVFRPVLKRGADRASDSRAKPQGLVNRCDPECSPNRLFSLVHHRPIGRPKIAQVAGLRKFSRFRAVRLADRSVVTRFPATG